MKRILIIGSGGAGKSTLARLLGDRLGMEVLHLDAFYWHPGWVETPKDKWQHRVKELIAKETWIMDGNYGSTLDLRLAAADTVIFLDFPRWLCLWRVIKRRWIYAGKTRPDMAPGCLEKVDWEFLNWVWSYPERSRPRVVAKLAALPANQQVIVLRSPAAVQSFLQTL